MKMWMSGLARFQFVRFALIGGINTAFSYGVYAGLLFTGINYAVSNLLALIAGIFFSFKTQGTYVFNNTNNRLLGRFVICWGMIYVINVLIIKVLMQFGLDPYTAGAVRNFLSFNAQHCQAIILTQWAVLKPSMQPGI